MPEVMLYKGGVESMLEGEFLEQKGEPRDDTMWKWKAVLFSGISFADTDTRLRVVRVAVVTLTL